ncbi:MAG: hypothetical protein DWI22_00185 [Planctomycetota bacterium]|nr:MAG: hypothetical protein DWI22_00185 [Planctomycetota bacterium]
MSRDTLNRLKRLQSLPMLKELKIASIKVGTRHRKDMGDLKSLAHSIREEGLLQPIGVTEKLELVFGERRLRAHKDILKKKTILARIVDVTSIIQGEYTENEVRKDFTPSERVAIAKAIERQIGNRRGQRTDKQPVQKLHKLALGKRPVIRPLKNPASATTKPIAKLPKLFRTALPD